MADRGLLSDLPETATLVEVLPRDGWQRLSAFVPTDTKVEFVNRIAATGIEEVEVTSFAHPEAVPNLRDAEEVASRIDRVEGVTYRALVPNVEGMNRAIAADLDKVNALVTVSETYSRKNQGMGLEGALAQLETVAGLAAEHGMVVEAGIGTSFYCPYEGKTPMHGTLSVVERAVDAGVDQVTLAATMGLADPAEVVALLGAVFERWPSLDVGLHLHDTNGMAAANALAALGCGVARFDASLCGLGGGVVLPEGMADVGNVPTEDLLHLLTRLGVETRVEFKAVERLAHDLIERLELEPRSHVLRGGTPERLLDRIAGRE